MCQSTISPATSQRKPAAKPLSWSWLLRPQAGAGYLEINGTLYHVAEQQFEYDRGMAGRLWDVRKPDGTTYRVCENAEGELACDCPDATFRTRRCKHATAVREAYAALEAEERLAAFLAPVPVNTPF